MKKESLKKIVFVNNKLIIRGTRGSSKIKAFDINKMIIRGENKMKKYKVGMYGGKFMPLHKGHNYCIEFASRECEVVYAILFYGGSDEIKILENNKEEYLTVEEREKHLKKICKKYDNVIPVLIDVTNCKDDKGEEDWDAETPLVRAVTGPRLDAVYSSEPSYGPYFKRAYPEAVHRVVDYKRIHYPISGTKIRNMKNEKERELWVI